MFLFVLTLPRLSVASIMVRASACSSIMIEILGSSHQSLHGYISDRRQQALFKGVGGCFGSPKR